MKILVVGGAGYIGSHMLKRFQDTEHKVEVLDNLSTGFETNCLDFTLHKCDLANREKVYSILQNNYDLVMHFASYINVGESYINPKKYYENNVTNTLNLLDCMVDLKISKFIFSSTAAVYGEPSLIPIDEEQPLKPVNPYGNTKAIVENILADYQTTYGLNQVIFRYFNVAGADPEAEIGEFHQPETHLIPLILDAVDGKRDALTIFGTDYDTPDGTCIRDYVHVCDLVEAHILGLKWLQEDRGSRVFNLGTGDGFSVREVVEHAAQVTKKTVPIIESARRPGDCTKLLSGSSRAVSELGWSATRSNMKQMITDAWRWHQNGDYKK